ncbi:hypothetical protein HDV00_003401 [Rhizophlyctis rosea]|nr:hypothetical protein HDV00_003401 [Rhizophlyctis rosea]
MARKRQRPRYLPADSNSSTAAADESCNHSSPEPPSHKHGVKEKPPLPFFPLEVWTTILLRVASPNLLVQISKAFYYTLGQDSHTRSTYLQHHLTPKLSLLRAVLSPTHRPLLTANVTNILVNADALLPRYLVQTSHQLSDITYPDDGPPLKTEVLAVICHRGHLLYGDNLALSDEITDYDRFEEWFDVWARRNTINFVSEAYGKLLTNLLTELISKYKFILDPLQNAHANLHRVRDTFCYLLTTQKDDSAFTWLNLMSTLSCNKPKYINSINDCIMTHAILNKWQDPSQPPDYTQVEWLLTQGFTITPTVTNTCLTGFTPHHLPTWIPFFLSHVSESHIVHTIATHMVQNSLLYAMSPDHYTTLRTLLPTFDTYLHSILPLPQDRSTIFLNTNLSNVLNFGLTTTLTTTYLETLFCNRSHAVLDTTDAYASRMKFHNTYNETPHLDRLIPSMIKKGFRMKPAYIPWVVWRFGARDVGPGHNFQFENSAMQVVKPLLDQVGETVRTCTWIEELEEWERHVGRGVEVMEAAQRDWEGRMKETDNRRLSEAADFKSGEVKQNTQPGSGGGGVSPLGIGIGAEVYGIAHLKKCRDTLDGVYHVITECLR